MPEYFGSSASDKRLRYDTVKAGLMTEQTSFTAHWRELSDYLMPRRSRFFAGDRNKGDKRNQNIIDSTGRFSVRTLQSGLHAGLTSPARPWFNLTTPDQDMAKVPAVKQWLSVVTKRMLAVMQQTNLYNCLPIIYGDMGVFGTACMGVVQDTKDLFRCYPYPIGSYALGLDTRGLVSSFVRDYRLSTRQVIEQFALTPDRKRIDWTKVSQTVKTNWEKALYEEPVDLTWLVLPNPYADPNRLESRYKPFASCHWETGSNEGKFLREAGFDQFPMLAPRWDITGEDTYGTDCPGMTALPDVKQLQDMQRAKALAIQKMIKPPLQAPTSLLHQKVSQIPGDVTFVDMAQGAHGIKSIHDVQINLQHFVDDIGATQRRVQRAFYEDLFLMLAQSDNPSTQPITAEEVRERHEEKLLALGPVLERTSDELLEPLIDRIYPMMDAAGLIPRPPQILEGVKLKAEYTSIMAQAQKLVGVVGLDRFMGTVSTLAQSFPDVRHKIDSNRAVDVYEDALGIEPGIVRPTEEAQQLAQAEAEAAQRQAEAEQAQKMAAAMKSAGTTPMTGDTALSRIAGGAAAAA